MGNRITRPRSRLAWYSPNGRIGLNENIPSELRSRVRRHEKIEFERRKEGDGQRAAHRHALQAEHKGMTRHQIAVYEGRLGAIARWHPAIHHRKR